MCTHNYCVASLHCTLYCIQKKLLLLILVATSIWSRLLQLNRKSQHRVLLPYFPMQEMVPSPNHVIGCACLASLAQFAAQLGGDEERNAAVHARVRTQLLDYTKPVRHLREW